MMKRLSLYLLLMLGLWHLPQLAKAQKKNLHIFTMQNAAELKDFFTYTPDRIPFVSAHRGGPTPGYPENCIATFEHTLSKTYATLEVDPRYTKDGQMVLMHDPTVDRTSNGRGKVADLTLAEIKKLRLKDRQQQQTSYTIPTLDEALQWAAGKTILVLDSKDIPGVERAKKIVANKAEANAILIIYSYEDALKVYQYNPNILMEVVIADDETFNKFEKSGVPFENVLAFVTHQEPKDPQIFNKLHQKKVMAMRGTAFLYDKAYTDGKIDRTTLLKSYRKLIEGGTDIIEADLGIDAGEALAPLFNKRSSKSKYFQRKTLEASSDIKPNIVWIITEDIAPDLSCYGAPLVKTPHVDQLAKSGVRYNQVFATGPVCSASRSALITAMYQTSIDAQNHRSHRHDGYTLPAPVQPITHYFKEKGYFTANGMMGPQGIKGAGTTDYNFQSHGPIFDGSDWGQRQPGQPFFAQVQIAVTHRGKIWQTDVQQKVPQINPDAIKLPPYYPDHPIAREDWATYLESIQLMDNYVGKILDRLKREGLDKNTIVVFSSDHGRCHVRGKQFLYEEGIHIPLLIKWPGKLAPNTTNNDLISSIDISASLLAIAGVTLPAYMEGQSFLTTPYQKRDYIIAARDRMDETIDKMRAVRTDQFKYIKNYLPDRPYMQPNAYKEKEYPVWNLLKQLNQAEKLTKAQALFCAPNKPEEELYDLKTDPYEIHNLATDKHHRQQLLTMREQLANWIEKTQDQGAIDKQYQQN